MTDGDEYILNTIVYYMFVLYNPGTDEKHAKEVEIFFVCWGLNLGILG